MFIGWGAGFQFYILSLVAVVSFVALSHFEWNVALTALNALAFIGPHYVFVDAPPRILLTPWIVDVLYYGSVLSTFFII